MPDGDISKLARCQDIPYHVLLKIARDAAAGMHFLSRRGLVHRDLSARNLLVKKEGDSMIAKVVSSSWKLKIKEILE